jgi:hypothetical protein
VPLTPSKAQSMPPSTMRCGGTTCGGKVPSVEPRMTAVRGMPLIPAAASSSCDGSIVPYDAFKIRLPAPEDEGFVVKTTARDFVRSVLPGTTGLAVTVYESLEPPGTETRND